MKPIDRLVWIDLETTGLDPEKDQILEVAIVVTDGKLTELATEHWTVKPPAGLPALHQAVVKMHSKNGLFSELHEGDPLAVVDILAAAVVHTWSASGGPICGSTPQFDKRFIDRYMPLLSSCFNHRVFDASTLKLAWCLATRQEWKEGAPAHRALDDIRYSIEVAKQCGTGFVRKEDPIGDQSRHDYPDPMVPK